MGRGVKEVRKPDMDVIKQPFTTLWVFSESGHEYFVYIVTKSSPKSREH